MMSFKNIMYEWQSVGCFMESSWIIPWRIQWDNDGILPSGVIKRGWRENSQTNWRFSALRKSERTIHAVFDDT